VNAVFLKLGFIDHPYAWTASRALRSPP